MTVGIGDVTTGGGVLFTPEQGAETVRSYLRARTRPRLDNQEQAEPTTRDKVAEMMRAGASLEDIARAGGKFAPETETFVASVEERTGAPWLAIGGAVLVLGAVGVFFLRGRRK